MNFLGSYFLGQPIFKLNENFTEAAIKLFKTLLESPIQVIFNLEIFFFAQLNKFLFGSYFFGQPTFKLNENFTEASIKLLRTLFESPIQQICNFEIGFFFYLFNSKNIRQNLSWV